MPQGRGGRNNTVRPVIPMTIKTSNHDTIPEIFGRGIRYAAQPRSHTGINNKILGPAMTQAAKGSMRFFHPGLRKYHKPKMR